MNAINVAKMGHLIYITNFKNVQLMTSSVNFIKTISLSLLYLRNLIQIGPQKTIGKLLCRYRASLFCLGIT